MSKPKILLHVCCGPCALNSIQELSGDYSVTLYFYNPNIYPQEEYNKRKIQISRYASEKSIPLYDEDYNEKEFLNIIKGYETDKEGGNRCDLCYHFRLVKTAKKARELKIMSFTTTLTISPHKNHERVLKAGQLAEKDCQISYIDKNFKKKDGFKKTMIMAREAGFYIQNYCGCRFSLRHDK